MNELKDEVVYGTLFSFKKSKWLDEDELFNRWSVKPETKSGWFECENEIGDTFLFNYGFPLPYAWRNLNGLRVFVGTWAGSRYEKSKIF